MSAYRRGKAKHFNYLYSIASDTRKPTHSCKLPPVAHVAEPNNLLMADADGRAGLMGHICWPAACC